jgi:hypothetical protein
MKRSSRGIRQRKNYLLLLSERSSARHEWSAAGGAEPYFSFCLELDFRRDVSRMLVGRGRGYGTRRCHLPFADRPDVRITSVRRGTARFRGHDSVSVCEIRPWKRHSFPGLQGSIFGVSFCTSRKGGRRQLRNACGNSNFLFRTLTLPCQTSTPYERPIGISRTGAYFIATL